MLVLSLLQKKKDQSSRFLKVIDKSFQEGNYSFCF